MAYTKKVWADGSAGGTPIVAAELNRIENGVAAAVEGFGVKAIVSLTQAEYDALATKVDTTLYVIYA